MEPQSARACSTQKLTGTFLFQDYQALHIFMYSSEHLDFHKLLSVKSNNAEDKLVPSLAQLLKVSPAYDFTKQKLRIHSKFHAITPFFLGNFFFSLFFFFLPEQQSLFMYF